jgi:hypothetical protein
MALLVTMALKITGNNCTDEVQSNWSFLADMYKDIGGAISLILLLVRHASLVS